MDDRALARRLADLGTAGDKDSNEQAGGQRAAGGTHERQTLPRPVWFRVG
jgi:hypothetical protein